MKIKSSSLEVFYIVWITSDVISTLLEVVKTKDDAKKVLNEVISLGKLSWYNLRRAYNARYLLVIANNSGHTP